MLQDYALYGQLEDVLPFVLHIGSGLSDKGFSRYSHSFLVSVTFFSFTRASYFSKSPCLGAIFSSSELSVFFFFSFFSYKSFLLLEKSIVRGCLLVFRTLVFLLHSLCFGFGSVGSSLSSALSWKRVCSGCLVFCPRLILLLGLLFLGFFSFWGLTTSSIDKVGSSLLEDGCRGSIGRWYWWRCWRFSCRFRRLHNLEW